MIYKYCNTNSIRNLNLSCSHGDLSKLDSYKLRNNEFEIEIFHCKRCNGLWKKTKFNNIEKWLQVGEVTVNQNEYIPFDFIGYYPIEYFEVDEAYIYDTSIFCGNPKEFRKYHGLTCSPKSLTLIEKVSEEDIGCCSSKTERFICSKCGTKWELTEDYDTHHGYARSAKKI